MGVVVVGWYRIIEGEVIQQLTLQSLGRTTFMKNGIPQNCDRSGFGKS